MDSQVDRGVTRVKTQIRTAQAAELARDPALARVPRASVAATTCPAASTERQRIGRRVRRPTETRRIEHRPPRRRCTSLECARREVHGARMHAFRRDPSPRIEKTGVGSSGAPSMGTVFVQSRAMHSPNRAFEARARPVEGVRPADRCGLRALCARICSFEAAMSTGAATRRRQLRWIPQVGAAEFRAENAKRAEEPSPERPSAPRPATLAIAGSGATSGSRAAAPSVRAAERARARALAQGFRHWCDDIGILGVFSC